MTAIALTTGIPDRSGWFTQTGQVLRRWLISSWRQAWGPVMSLIQPVIWIVLGYGGYLLAVPGVIGGGALLATGLFSSMSGFSGATVLMMIGGAGMVIGLVGVAAIIFGFIQGNATVEQARARRRELSDQRDALKRELQELRQLQPPAPTNAGYMVTVFRF